MGINSCLMQGSIMARNRKILINMAIVGKRNKTYLKMLPIILRDSQSNLIKTYLIVHLILNLLEILVRIVIMNENLLRQTEIWYC